MAKPRRAEVRIIKERRHLVLAVSIVLAGGEPTVFRFEAICRHTLRSVLCLYGRSWPLSDAIAADIVRSALELIGAQRPPWAWGQPEYTEEDSAATRIGFTHCLNCGQRLEEERFKFCGKECGGRYRNEFEKSLEAAAAARVRALAAREAYRKNGKSVRCETCQQAFKPSKAGQKFCSRECSGGRSVAQKMNGKHHPWMNGKKAGFGVANGVAVSLAKTGTRDESTAPLNASTDHTTSSSRAIEPTSAPGSGAYTAAGSSKDANGRTESTAA